VIEAVNLVKRYGKVRAVDDLSFEVLPGRVTGFLGPNGAGKSTTMRMIVGLDAPTSGDVRVDGRSYRSIRRPLLEVGAVLESGSLHGGRSAENHLLCLAQSNGIGRRRVREVLDLVGIEQVARRRAGGFSLGMRQRLGLAAALLGDPAVLICDEPVNGLDPEGILWIRTFLRGLADEGRTVFVSSHLMSEMALMASHLVLVGRGRLIASGTTEDIIARASVAHVLVRTPDPERLRRVLAEAHATVETDGAETRLRVSGLAIEGIGDLAAAHGLTLHELTPQQASLESAFMALTSDSLEYHPGAVA